MIRCAAVLFDLDGVLVSSEAAIQAMWRRWALRRGFDPEEVVALTPGRPAVDTIRIVAPDLDAPAEALALEPEQVADAASLEPVAGSPALVRSLRPGTWAVVTSGTRFVATTRLEAVGIPEPEVLITADDVTEGKPSPEGYLSAARLLGVRPEDCVVVEDARSGVLAARAAGMRVVGVEGPQLGPREDVVLGVPDLTAISARYDDGGLVLSVGGRVTTP